MSKIICEICGTSYQETAESCPICGCPKDAAEALLGEDILLDGAATEYDAAVPAAPKKNIFDFDEVNEPRSIPEELDDDDDYEDEDEDEDYDEEEEDEDDEEPRSNTFVVILLTILIFALLAAAGFVFVRYFLPNMKAEETVPTTAAVQVEDPVVSEEAGVPCEYMTMNNAAKAELSEIGQQFLLNVIVKPENTTDTILYVSADESIATVSADGKITAVAEGETTIRISCGNNSMECPVVVKRVEETVPATTEATVPVQEEAGEQETEPAANPVDSNVVLKLKKTDIQLGVYYYVTLQLDCDLDPTQVTWTSEHPHIATVDEKGVVTAVKEGTTEITAKYGDQVVTCIVRCGWY